jgi:hypothetical protein
MNIISQLHQMGVALGSGTYGDATVAFTRGMLVSALTMNPAKQTVQPINEVRGNLSIRRVTQGGLDYDGSLSFPMDVGDATSASIGDFIAALLGLDTGTSLGGSLYKHRLQVLDTATPPWLNLWSDKDAVLRQYKGFRPASIKISMKAGDGQISCEVSGLYKDEADLAAQTLAFSTCPLLLPHNVVTFTVGGASVTNFDTCDIEIATTQEAFRALGNSRVVNNVYRKDVKVEVSLSGIAFADETERAKYKANTTSSLGIKVTDSAANYLELVAPETYWTAFEGPNVSGTDLLKVSGKHLVTGALANWYFDLKNAYSKRYDTGAAIV